MSQETQPQSGPKPKPAPARAAGWTEPGRWLRAFGYLLFFSAPISIAGGEAAILLLQLTALYWFWRERPGRSLPGWLLAAFAPLPLAALLSALFNPDVPGNLVHLRELHRLILPLPLILILALDHSDRRRLLLTMLAPLVLMGAYSIIQHYWGVDWLRPEGKELVKPFRSGDVVTYYGRGAFTHQLTFAGLMLINAPLFAALAWQATGRMRMIWWLGTAGAMTGVLFSMSRSGWIGAAVGLSLLAIGFPRRIAVPLVGVALLVTLAATAVGTGWVKDVLGEKNKTGLIGRLAVTSLQRDGGRLYTWEAALMGIREHPIVGVGLGNDEYYFPGYRKTVGEKYGFTFKRYLKTHAHNIYLQIAFELGLVGLAAYLYLWGAVLWWGIFWLRKAGGGFPFESALIRGASAGLAGSMVAGLFEANFTDSEVQIMILIAMGLIIHSGLVIRRGLKETPG